jgi:hypothetical protein
MDDAVEVRDAGPKGQGVFALRDFSRGGLILRFARGRVVHTDELATLTPWEQEHLATIPGIALGSRCGRRDGNSRVCDMGQA